MTNKTKVAVIATASSKPGLSDMNKSPYGFRMTVTEDKMAAAQFKRWMEVYGIKTVAIVYDKKDPTASVMGTEIWPMVLKKLDITILNEKEPITYVTGENGFEDHVKKVKAINPDGICFSGYHRDAGHFAKEVRRQGLKHPLIGQNQSLGPAFIEAAGEAAEDFWSVGLFYVDDPNPKAQAYVKEFRKRCEKRYPDIICDPEQTDVVVHDILHSIVDIMKKRSITGDAQRLQEERDKVRDGLANMGVWRGTAGMMAFDKKGDGIRTIHILKVKDGRWQPAY
ncbi:ABC transporter substrate-binding protein [Thermodesulfobacteriota bacterium]